MKEIILLMTESEMVHKFDVFRIPAVDICLDKYKRLLAAVESGQSVDSSNIKSNTCALCYKHYGDCTLCGLKFVDRKCGYPDSAWMRIYDIIDDEDDYKEELITAINNMISLLERVKSEGFDEFTYNDCDHCYDCGQTYPTSKLVGVVGYGKLCTHCASRFAE